MTGKRRYAGRARAAIAVALALALFGPGPLVSPSPGGDEGSRSTPTPPTLLMVNVNETTCLAPAPVGGVFAGTDGGGIARWTLDGTLATLHTTADGGLFSNHIVDIAPGIGYALAITDTDRPLVHATGAIGDRWFDLGTVEDAQGPLAALEGKDDGFLVIDDNGSIYLSGNGAQWDRFEPTGMPATGWDIADRDGDTVAISNGTGVVLVDLPTNETQVISSPAVVDLDLDGDMLAIASSETPDVYDLGSGSWLDNNVTEAVKDLDEGWSIVEVQGSRLVATTLNGTVVEVNVSMTSSEGVELKGELSSEVDANVTDMLLLENDGVLLSTLEGNWAMVDGDVSPFLSTEISMPPSNEILSVSYEEDTLWALTPMGLSSLSFDSRDHPVRWSEGPDLGSDVGGGILETAFLEGRFYITGYGPGIHTYDTFASSSASRWGRAHVFGDSRDDVNDLIVVNGTLYTGGAYGLDRMVSGSDPPTFEMVTGSPAGILSMYMVAPMLMFIGTENGLSSYNLESGEWDAPEDILKGLVTEPVSDISKGWHTLKFCIGDTLYGALNAQGMEGRVLVEGSDIVRLSSRYGVGDPVWAVTGGRAFTVLDLDIPIDEPERDWMGRAWIYDVTVAPDGVSYMATDSGVHRIERFRTSWSNWTTSNGLSANDIRDLSIIPGTDQLWIGAYGGVDVLDVSTGSLERIGAEDGIPSNLVYDIVPVGHDVWIGTDEGGAAVADFDDRVWQVYNMSTGLIADDVQALEVHGDLVLFGTDEGVTVLDKRNSTIESYTATSSALPGNWIWCAHSTAEGVYVGTDKGLALFSPKDDSWKVIGTDELEGASVRALTNDLARHLWVGTDDGLSILSLDDDSEVVWSKELDRESGLPGDEVLALRRTSDNSMWAGTSAGAAVIDSGWGVQATFTTDDGLVHDRVTAIEEGPDDTIWLGTAGGLSRVTKEWWDILPQWTSPVIDIPDVYITLDNIVVDPEEPNEGDVVNVSTTVANPSGKRAIVHVGLFYDDGGSRGEEISTAIAYTEPGETYRVTLSWTAVGGDQNLWVVADPNDLVPESNERNNLVALNMHVNRYPMILDLSVGPPSGNSELPHQTASIQFNFTYYDADGDRPTCTTVSVPGTSERGVITTLWGYPEEGIGHVGHINVPVGNSTIEFFVTDGLTSVTVTRDISINFAIVVDGLDRGVRDDGNLRFTVSTVGPWEGTDIYGVSIRFVEPGTEINDPDDWFGSGQLITADIEGEEWYCPIKDLDEGTYDLWVVAMDDRAIYALYLEEDVKISSTLEDRGVDLPLLIVSICIVIAVVSSVVLYKKRGSTD